MLFVMQCFISHESTGQQFSIERLETDIETWKSIDWPRHDLSWLQLASNLYHSELLSNQACMRSIKGKRGNTKVSKSTFNFSFLYIFLNKTFVLRAFRPTACLNKYEFIKLKVWGQKSWCRGQSIDLQFSFPTFLWNNVDHYFHFILYVPTTCLY